MDQSTPPPVVGDATGVTDADPRDFATVLRAAIARRGLTLARARARVGRDVVSVATLSNWQSGRSLPGRRVSRDVLRSLDAVLELPTGTLEGALEATRARHRAEAERVLGPGPLHPKADRIQLLYDRLGLDFQDGFTRLSVHEHVELGASGAPHRIDMSLTLRAERDGLDSFTTFKSVNLTGPTQGIGLIEAVRGCVLRRSTIDDDGRVGVAEFELPRAMRRGDLWAVRVRETLPDLPDVDVDPESYRAYGRIHRSAFRDASLEVVFHPDLLPVSVEQFYEPADTGRLSEPDGLFEADTYGRRPLYGRTAQSHIIGRGPGMTGMRWVWR